MKKNLSILLLLFGFNAFATDCDKHPIYCQIIKNSPKINKKYAMKVSNIIYKMHRKYHIPTRIFTAILRQESNYKLGAKGCYKGIREKTDAELQWAFHSEKKTNLGIPVMTESKVCTDFGISQIYFKTAKKFGFNIYNLTTDLEYSIEAGAIVLADFMKRYEARDNDWWVRYNCGTKSTTKRDTCQIYKKMVERYL